MKTCMAQIRESLIIQSLVPSLRVVLQKTQANGEYVSPVYQVMQADTSSIMFPVSMVGQHKLNIEWLTFLIVIFLVMCTKN